MAISTPLPNTSTNTSTGGSLVDPASSSTLGPQGLSHTPVSTLRTPSFLLFPPLPFPLAGEQCPGMLKALPLLPGPWTYTKRWVQFHLSASDRGGMEHCGKTEQRYPRSTGAVRNQTRLRGRGDPQAGHRWMSRSSAVGVVGEASWQKGQSQRWPRA